MNYEKIYNQICNRAYLRKWNRKTAQVYVERHHILPKAMGGLDTKNNLVFLTAREHFVCHMLLVKFVTNNNKFKMASALSKMMSSNLFQNRKINSRTFETARILFSKNNPFKTDKVINIVKERMSGDANPMKNPLTAKRVSEKTKGKRIGIENSFYGQTHSEKSLTKMRKPRSEEAKKNMRRTEEQKKQLSIRNTGRIRDDLKQRNIESAALWNVQMPNGQNVVIKNLNNFAREQGIKNHWLYGGGNKGYKVTKL